MALDRTQVLRDQYAAVNERDFERAMSHYADDVVLFVAGQGIRSGACVGREETGKWFGDWFQTFDRDARFEIIEIDEREDGSIVLKAEHHARGRASGVEVRGGILWRYWFRDEKIIRVEGSGEFDGPPGNPG